MVVNTKAEEIGGTTVDTAVNFLLNPDVKNKSDHSKVGFLKKKGLTDAEISEAFNRAKADPRYLPIPNESLQPYIYPQQTVSFWSQFSNLSSSFIVIAVALYGLHRFYKLYVEPWLFGIKSDAEQERDMTKVIIELNNSVSELKNSVCALESTVTSQREQIDRILLAEGSPYLPIPLAVAEVKTEIGSLKSLLISRHQFPAVPKVSSPSIPHWQLPSSDTEEPKPETIEEKTNEAPVSVSTSPEVETPTDKLQSKSDSEQSSIESYFDPAVSVGSIENIQNGFSLDNGSTDC